MTAAIAWAGGGAFVLSLAYFAYTYAVTLADPGAGRLGVAASCLANTGLFLAFAGHHSLFARPRLKRWLRRVVPSHLERSTFVWIASLLLITTCAAWQPVPGTLYRHVGIAAWPHVVLVSAGVVLTVVSARLLDPLDLSGIRQAQARDRTGGELKVGFPYNLVRHPLYLGWVLMVFGVPVMTWNRALMAVLTTSYLLVAVRWEEHLLVHEFGARYEAYRRRVHWRILPFVY